MCFPMNIAKLLRTPFLQNTSNDCSGATDRTLNSVFTRKKDLIF